MIAIVDYDMGNVGSVANMLRRVGATDVVLTRDPAILERAEKLILPGVGSFDTGMSHLESFGLLDVLDRRVNHEGTPLLGICLGMQLLCDSSEEGMRPGLGWVDARARRFAFAPEHGLKVPHMGWSYVRVRRSNPLLPEGGRARFYFVHSYYVEVSSPNDVIATAVYGGEFACAMQNGNVMGVQFHPEKSHRFGMALLERFVRL